ncbi:MAG: hypothetical protein WCG27_08200, partial [Pseudomonadota bacterium]
MPKIFTPYILGLLLGFLLLAMTGCGSKEDKEENAILSANIYLTVKECQKAIDVLEDNGRNMRSANYVKALASAYALSLWALQGKHAGDGYGFPFDRPLLEFAERLLELDTRLPECKDVH